MILIDKSILYSRYLWQWHKIFMANVHTSSVTIKHIVSWQCVVLRVRHQFLVVPRQADRTWCFPPPQIEKYRESDFSEHKFHKNASKCVANFNSNFHLSCFCQRASCGGGKFSRGWQNCFPQKQKKYIRIKSRLHKKKKWNKRPTLNHSLSEIHFLCTFISKGTPAVPSKPPPTQHQRNHISLELQTVNFTFGTAYPRLIAFF